MDRFGNGEELVLDNVFDSADHKPSFKFFDKELLLGMCVLAGCDFLPSVPGIGIAKAYALVSKYRNLERVLSVLKLDKGKQMPEDYYQLFRQAMAVFQHAQIYDVEMRKLRHMKLLPEELLQALDGEIDFLGPDMPPSIAASIAEGRLNPITMEAFDHSPSNECRQDAQKIKTIKRLPRPEAAEVSPEESCLTVFSRSDREKHVPDKRIKPVPDNKNSKEVLALEKLSLPLEVQSTNEDKSVLDCISFKIPDNNPFKRRKDEPHLNLQSVEEISVVNEVEYIELSCDTTDDLISKTPEKSPKKRKLKKVLSDQVASFAEQISGVTQEENLECSKLIPESQESVNSKTNRVIGRKRVVGKENKKKSNCKSSGVQKNSILNFFSRV